MAKHYVGEAGTEFVFDTGVIIGSATLQYIKYQKPNGGVEGSFSASLYDSYSALAQATGTYLLKRTLTASDFDTPGEWRFQAFVAAVGGTWLGEMAKLNIYDEFE